MIDGRGGDARAADVAIEGDRIVRVGDVPEPGRTELDAAGCLVTPGFVDAHVHGDAILFSDRVHLPALHQGVTTYVIGQDGCSFAPGTAETVAQMSDYFAAVNGRLPTTAPWSVGEFVGAFDGLSTVNVAYLAPHGNIRLNVVGTASRAATRDELAAMQRQVEEALDDGAVGLSSGLDYIPSRYADTDELAALCRPVADAGAVYVTHMRGYGARRGRRDCARWPRSPARAASPRTCRISGRRRRRSSSCSTRSARRAPTSPTTRTPTAPAARSSPWPLCPCGFRKGASTT